MHTQQGRQRWQRWRQDPAVFSGCGCETQWVPLGVPVPPGRWGRRCSSSGNLLFGKKQKQVLLQEETFWRPGEDAEGKGSRGRWQPGIQLQCRLDAFRAGAEESGRNCPTCDSKGISFVPACAKSSNQNHPLVVLPTDRRGVCSW